MSLLVSLIGGDISTDTVVILNTDFSRIGGSPPVYSGVKFGADGNQYARQSNGGYSNMGAWLIKGAAASYYLQMVLNSGTLTTDDGDGQQMNGDLEYDVQDSSAGSQTANATVTFEISTDAPGTTVVAGPRALSFEADYESEA